MVVVRWSPGRPIVIVISGRVHYDRWWSIDGRPISMVLWHVNRTRVIDVSG